MVLFLAKDFSMLSKMRIKLRMLWGHASISTMVGFPKFLSPYELTKSSWATRIKSHTEVPDVYKSFYKPFSADKSSFPYTVLTPSYENFIHKTTEKLIIDCCHDIYILERKGDSFDTQCYPVDGISYVEMRTALLASSFKLCGVTNQGIHASATLQFNSITDYLFTPILKRVRLVPVDSKNFDQSAELAKFDCLANVNFKFMNLAKHSLLEGEKVIHFVIQPEIQESLLTFLGKTYNRTISPTHISILTDQELILIREDAVRRKEDRYGSIWDYIPLSKVKSLSVSEKASDLLGLAVQLPEGTSFELLFQASAKDELNQLLNQFGRNPSCNSLRSQRSVL